MKVLVAPAAKSYLTLKRKNVTLPVFVAYFQTQEQPKTFLMNAKSVEI
jgi:hypothetical protein